jgi:hypothetical protein
MRKYVVLLKIIIGVSVKDNAKKSVEIFLTFCRIKE